MSTEAHEYDKDAPFLKKIGTISDKYCLSRLTEYTMNNFKRELNSMTSIFNQENGTDYALIVRWNKENRDVSIDIEGINQTKRG